MEGSTLDGTTRTGSTAAAPPRHRERGEDGPGGFGRAAGWTLLGTAVPGAGLLNARRRALGWLALVPFALVVGAAVVLWGTGSAVDVAQRYVLDADVLLGLAVAAAAVGLAWCAVVVGTHVAQRRHRGVRGHRLASSLLVLVLLAVVALPAATATRYALVSRSLITSLFPSSGAAAGTDEPTGTAQDPWAGIPRVNVLLVGADSGADRIGTRPDTLIVASIDTTTGDTVIFGLPRQLADVPFPAGSAAAQAWPAACAANGAGGCWLNAAYLFGTQNPQLFPGVDDPGLAATEQAAAGVVGMDIDYTAMVNLAGFQDLIDAMGGIRLTVDRRIPIGGGERLSSTGRVIGTYPVTGYIEPGRDQLLDGYHAEWYARSRWQSDNTDRMDRQRCLINAAVQQYSVLDLARAFPQLAASAQRDVTTDIPANRLSAFVDLGRKVKEAPLRSLAFNEPLVNTGKPDYDQIHQLVQQALVPPAPAPSSSPTTTTPTASPSTSTASPSSTGGPTPSPTTSTPSGEAVDASSVCPS